MSETTLAPLTTSGQFDAPISSFDPGAYNGINNALTAQNANNASLRAGINACATTPVTSSELDPTTVQYATINLTLAQLTSLNATPLVVIATPGTGKFIEFISAVLEFVYAAALTIGSAAGLTINYKSDASGADASVSRAVTGLFDQTANTLVHIKPVATNIIAASTALLNEPLAMTVATADMTGGTGSSAILKIAYRVHSGF